MEEEKEMKANFKVEDRNADRLVIRDIGPWDKHMTITNDAENVVKHLLQTGVLQPVQRLLYYDSEGYLDEIVHDGEKFVGFKHIEQKRT